ncbi:hypothetical protein EUV02_05500 [Polymorphobacter arshaanensis]|uniref:Lysoplasmalogenase n=1 Tax=Glacieibacterium arshaanense TaxID=2511025 RepID=A0A4Y9ES12_9SPHN|nr:hypothetical protein [Polymorphobacter arshaanensis]TFU06441.1 hypothetical protein EUV02_05500 [Polymorphobacter arshaanensis]
MLLKLLFMTMLLGTCGIAFWKGRNSEKWTAVLLLSAAVASWVFETRHFYGTETGILIIDLMLLAYLLVLALQSDRFWPLWAAAFQVVGTSIHLASIVDSTIWPAAYATAQVFWAYPVLLALGVGTWLEARYRAW